jgi:hypothetical protein
MTLTIGSKTPRVGPSKTRSARPDDPIFSRSFVIGETRIGVASAEGNAPSSCESPHNSHITDLDFSAYKQHHDAGKVSLGIDNHVASKYEQWLPLPQRAAIHFWSWVALLLIPAGLILGYLYSWWWALLVPAHRIVWNANKKSVAQFVLDFVEGNPWFYEVVRGDGNWIYRWNDRSTSSGDGLPCQRVGSVPKASRREGTAPRPNPKAFVDWMRREADRREAEVAAKFKPRESPIKEVLARQASPSESFDLDWKPSQYAGNAYRSTGAISSQQYNALPTLTPDAAIYKHGWIGSPRPAGDSSPVAWEPYGVPLDRLEVALKAGHMVTERDGNTLIGRQDEITTRISVDQPTDRKTEDGSIRAVITIRTELPTELASSIAKPIFIDGINRMTTIGALMIENKRLVIGSRITLYEGEDAWDLQALLVISAALSSAQSMLGAIHWALTKERRTDDCDIASRWSDQDMEEVRGHLAQVSVCSAGKGGLTAEFGLHDGSISAVLGNQDTALWRLITDQPHPQAGGGLFCLLEMPHQANDPAHLGLIVERLNAMEMAPLDLPPHIGAWCAGTLGNNPAYVTFLPNFLHDKSGIAVNVSVWAAVRAKWANAMLAYLGLKVRATG